MCCMSIRACCDFNEIANLKTKVQYVLFIQGSTVVPIPYGMTDVITTMHSHLLVF